MEPNPSEAPMRAGVGRCELRTGSLGYPVMPIRDGFIGCFVPLDGLQLRQGGTARVRPCHLMSTSMSLAQASSGAIPRTSTFSPLRSEERRVGKECSSWELRAL